MKIIRKNEIKHLAFLLSPIVVLAITIFSIFISYHWLTDMLILLLKGYSVVYFLACSYIYYKLSRKKVKRYFKSFLVRTAYPTGASIFLAWVLLLPLMEGVNGIWDSQFFDMLITMILGYLIFFLLARLYKFIDMISSREDSYLNMDNQ